MQGLTIHLRSIEFDQGIVQKGDKIRVSITTLPEENKQSFLIDPKDLYNAHHFFTVNVTKKTRKIIFVFRKKSFIQNDPIIASTIVHADLFPKSRDDITNTDVKEIYIYEPLQHQRESGKYSPQRRIFGKMHIQMSLSDEFSDSNYNTKYQVSKSQKKGNYAKIESYANIDENLSNIRFVDNY